MLCTICWSVVGLREFNVVIEYQNFDVKLIRVIGHKSQAQIPQVKYGFMLWPIDFTRTHAYEGLKVITLSVIIPFWTWDGMWRWGIGRLSLRIKKMK